MENLNDDDNDDLLVKAGWQRDPKGYSELHAIILVSVIKVSNEKS